MAASGKAGILPASEGSASKWQVENTIGKLIKSCAILVE